MSGGERDDIRQFFNGLRRRMNHRVLFGANVKWATSWIRELLTSRLAVKTTVVQFDRLGWIIVEHGIQLRKRPDSFALQDVVNRAE